MKKRIFALILAVLLLTAAVVPAALASAGATAGDYYVYTENGKGLNVRDAPNGNVVGSLKYGTKVYCYWNEGGWALIDYTYNHPQYGEGTYACYISSRFLRKTKPGPKPSSASQTAAQETGTIEEMNAEFESAKIVTPYKIAVRPTRVTGWVNLRWAPSKSAAIIATYKSGDELLVIREMNNWLQVEDQDNGSVGFVNKAFVSQ